MTTVAMVVFAILIILARRPLLKQKSGIRLSPAKGVTFGQGMFVLRGNGVEFAFVKNWGVRVSCSGESVLLKFPTQSRYSISPKRIVFLYPSVRVEVDNLGVKFDCPEGYEFELHLPKPRFPFCVQASRKAVVFGDGCLRLALCNFDDFGITNAGADNLRIWGKLGKSARIDFDKSLSPLTIAELREYKRRNFGTIDTSTWAVVPTFDAKNFNSLQINSIRVKLDLSTREVRLPADFDMCILEAKHNCVLRGKGLLCLDSLGLSKILRLKKSGNKLLLVDLLTNISFRIESDTAFCCELQNRWGQNYLFMQSQKSECLLRLLPFYQYVDFCDLSSEINLSDIYVTPEGISIDATLRRLNLNILHGFWVDAGKLVQSVNYHFLPRKTQFLLAKLALSFVSAYPERQLQKSKKVRRLLILGLNYAVGNRDAECVIFCQKILPLIRNERAYQRVNLAISELLPKEDKEDNEYKLSKLLGVSLVGKTLSISPDKNVDIDTQILLRGKRLRLSIRRNWHSVNINDLRLNNVCSFDLSKLADNTLLTFD